MNDLNPGLSDTKCVCPLAVREELDTCIHREFVSFKIYTHCPGDDVVTIIASYKKEKGTQTLLF